MSVAIISAQELADVAVLACLGAPDEARVMRNFRPGILLCLEKFSVANVQAFRRSYVEGRKVVSVTDASVRPVTAEEIYEVVRTISALGTVGNLRYNAVSNNGTDFLDASTAKALEAVCAWAKNAQELLTPLPEGRRSKDDPRTYGKKHDAAKGVTEIPALVRTDIKRMVASGELPRATYSVRRRRCTHSWAIDVRISDVPGLRMYNPERLRADRDRPNAYTGLP